MSTTLETLQLLQQALANLDADDQHICAAYVSHAVALLEQSLAGDALA